VPQLEAWELVYVENNFLKRTHGSLSCVACHKGNGDATDKNAAHVDMIADPSEEDDVYCAGCHAGTVSQFATSLHRGQGGYYYLFEKRAGFDLRGDPHLQEEFDKECGTCHATCGQCHISRPNSVNGGFVNGHVFQGTPNMTNNCTACHGSRVGEEYLGQREGYQADVHVLPPISKRCEFCHEGAEFHGTGTELLTRYDDGNILMPRCEDCHDAEKEANEYHEKHWSDGESDPDVPYLSCQVCHSQDYKSCNACHTGGAGITGSSYLTYKIGKNYKKSQRYPYDYVVVRHIPIAPTTFEAWGVATLSNYSAEPTWKLATPHNIRRWTARTDTTGGGQCWSNCHNNWVDELTTYLRAEDLFDYEIEANQNVIIPTN
jgi:hypothetical protein